MEKQNDVTGSYEEMEYLDNEGYEESEEYAEDGEYYEESEEYIEDGEYCDESEEYAEDGEYCDESEEYAEDGEYYEESEEYAEDGEYYEESEEYAEDGEYYEESEEYAEDGEYYEESGEYAEDEDILYEDLEVYDDEESGQDAPPVKRRARKSGIAAIFADMGAMDKLMLAAGVGALILMLVTGGFYVTSRVRAGKTSEFMTVGSQLEGIDIIGDKGLLAVANATSARVLAQELLEQEQQQEPEEEPNKDYNEVDYSQNVTVSLKMVSVQKDLKIKFVNASTDKLIANVPFSVTVTTPDKKTEYWVDDDMDGIIYKKGITPGSYSVSVDEMKDEKYAKYIIPKDAQKTEVKKDIAYKKIDVSDEVKTESQINVAQEEQKKQEPEVESTLTDTVQWVESTAVPNTYIEVAKSDITDPRTLAKSGSFLRMAKEVKLNNSTATLQVGGSTLSLAADYTSIPGGQAEWSSSDAKVASVDGNGVVTPKAPGTAKITCTVTETVTESVSGGDETHTYTYSASCEVTVKAAEPKDLSLDKTALTVYLTEPAAITATVKDAPAGAAVTAKSSDTKVATVSVKNMTVTITGAKVGTATVTVEYTENGITSSATCAVTVKEHPKNDTKSKLKDNSGNQLYVLENNVYREAVYADYYKSGEKYFRKGEIKYTGWNTIDGKVYFFDAAGNKVKGEQVIQGAKYNFASDGSLVTGSGTMGIDVSKHNGSIDWNAVKNSGVSYVIIRCGYRGYTQGSLIIDSKFQQNIKGATAAGLKVGIYFFSQAVDEVEAVQEASFVLDAVKGYTISYPIFLDVEYSGAAGNSGRADKLDKNTRTAVCKAFCATIQSGGYTAGVYANKTWLQTMIDPGQLGAYKIWLAQYAATPTYTGRYDLWQYKSTGKISGISGNVDMNLSYLGY